MTSAASAAGVPRDPAPRIALVGRSNVGKSSLINALVGRRIARTSATPGRTRLANFYRVTLAGPGLAAIWLVDLPGYGYARAAGPVDGLRGPGAADGRPARGAPRSATGDPAAARRQFGEVVAGLVAGFTAALLVVDARHPSLASDAQALDWLDAHGLAAGIVATKVDKLSRAARARAIREITATLEGPALAFSAATGEGRDDLWRMIAELARERTPLTPE